MVINNMAATSSLCALLDDLSHSSDKSSILNQMQVLLNATSPSELRDVALNLSFDAIFSCLDTTDSEQAGVCCRVLDQLLCALDAMVLMQQFHVELIEGLAHPMLPVRQLCVQQIRRAFNSSVQQMSEIADVLIQMTLLLADDSLDVAKAAAEVLVILGGSTEGLEALFHGDICEKLRAIMEKGDIIRYRVYEVCVDIACLSAEALYHCASSGILQLLVNELHKDDILVQLNCIELLTRLALRQHGLSFLEQRGVIGKLAQWLENVDTDPMMSFLLPGLVKFFGNVAYVHPKDISESHPGFLPLVFSLSDSTDIAMKSLAVETVSFIGGTVEGKMVLDKYNCEMSTLCRTIGRMVKDAPTDVKVRVLSGLASILTLKVPEQTSDLLDLTKSWFGELVSTTSGSLNLLLDLANQPFIDIHCGVLEVFVTLATQPWAQKQFNEHPTFKEYILDRSTESGKESKLTKFNLVTTLAESPTALEMFGMPYIMKLKVYVQEGPFYARVETAVAMESGN